MYVFSMFRMRFIRADFDNQSLTFHLEWLPFNLPESHLTPRMHKWNTYTWTFRFSKLIQIKHHQQHDDT